MRQRNAADVVQCAVAVLLMTVALVEMAVTARASEYSSRDSRLALDLAGAWRVRIDPGRAGQDEGWYRSLDGEPMSLPGALHDAGLGTPAGPPTFNGPALATNHIGWAWYQREVRIDPSWAGRRIVLSIERCKWLSKVWIDDAYVGEFISLMTPHVYDVTAALTPGLHRITILVDNSNTVEAEAQAPTDVSGGPTTQPATAPAGAAPARVKRFHCGSSGITWHGLIGHISLTATEPAWID